MHRPLRLHATRSRLVLSFGACLVTLIPACDARSGSAGNQASGSSADVVAEARAFVDAYARDLLTGDRAAIAARYNTAGAYFLGNGRKEFMPHDSIVAQYRGAAWSPPASFSWRDLSFEPAGPDAVVVAGQFTWGPAGGAPPVTLSYTSLLQRQDGVLRIRVENESVDPTSVPARPATDSARR